MWAMYCDWRVGGWVWERERSRGERERNGYRYVHVAGKMGEIDRCSFLILISVGWFAGPYTS